MEPQVLVGFQPTPSWGFFDGPRRRGGADVRDRDQALPREWRGDGAGGARGARMGAGDARVDGRPEVLRPARNLAARVAADPGARRVRVRGRPRLRRLLDPRLAGDFRV